MFELRNGSPQIKLLTKIRLLQLADLSFVNRTLIAAIRKGNILQRDSRNFMLSTA